MIGMAEWIVCLLIFLRETKHDRGWLKLGLVGFFVLIAGLGIQLGWQKLEPRLRSLLDKDPSVHNRRVIYENARAMAEEHPWFGTGPGTFSTLYQFYRANPEDEWAAMAHNDWLETRITFGWVGTALLLAVLGVLGLKWFVPGGIPTSGVFIACLGISLGGCLLHATFDFPFQILSILTLFALLSAILFCCARHR